MESVNSFLCFIFSKIIHLFSRKRLLIFRYHRVLHDHDKFFPGDINKEEFKWQMSVIQKYFKPLTLDEAVNKLQNNKLSGNSVVVTFDDGYKDNVDNALLILKEYKIPAVFFITTGVLNEGILWNDVVIESIKKTKKTQIDFRNIGLKPYDIVNKKQKLIVIEDLINSIKYQSKVKRQECLDVIIKECGAPEPVNLMMSDKDLLTLHNEGMEIGGHTETHPILTKETLDAVKNEISSNKKYLENLLKIPITSFAYPNGLKDIDYTNEHVQLVKEAGYSQAVTSNKGFNNNATNVFELYRLSLWSKTSVSFLLRIMKLYVFNQSKIS